MPTLKGAETIISYLSPKGYDKGIVQTTTIKQNDRLK